MIIIYKENMCNINYIKKSLTNVKKYKLITLRRTWTSKNRPCKELNILFPEHSLSAVVRALIVESCIGWDQVVARGMPVTIILALNKEDEPRTWYFPGDGTWRSKNWWGRLGYNRCKRLSFLWCWDKGDL